MVNVLITGGKGQLAQCLKGQFDKAHGVSAVYTDVEDLDITREQAVLSRFEAAPPDYCINCAAYTAVDQAESEPGPAEAINAAGPRNLALACKEHGATLIHLSTDFVFDGRKKTPYTESDKPNPQSVYGRTKWEGEIAVADTLDTHYIFRTSWLYSPFGKNFMNTMLRLGVEREMTRVVDDQVGTPTYAGDLARVIVQLVTGEIRPAYGLYHYSNEGQASWFEFAREIFEQAGLPGAVEPIGSEEFPTPASRPEYSVLSKEKFRMATGLQVPGWKSSLGLALAKRESAGGGDR